MKTIEKENHMRVEPGTMRLICKNCGEGYQPTMPCPIEIYSSIVSGFKKIHKNCPLSALPGKKGE